MSDLQTPSFKSFLEHRAILEAYKNLFTPRQKEPWADKVWDMLQESYASIGGIKGRGFESKEQMVDQIPMWKLSVRQNDLVACVLYKDTNGRKLVAVGTNGDANGKQALYAILKDEFSRSYSEISGPLLKFVERNLPEIYKQYRIPVKDVPSILGKEIEAIDDYHYIRSIGGGRVQKVLIGTPGKTIT